MNRFKLLSMLFLLSSCGKEFLEERYSTSMAVPSKIEDYQAYLDAATTMNQFQGGLLNMVAAEEFYISSAAYHSLLNNNASNIAQKNSYLWLEDVFDGYASDEWDRTYVRIFRANFALDGINAIEPPAKLQEAWSHVKGGALFFRAQNFYHLAQTFCKPFDPQTAANELGIPLRLESDITIKSKRATLQETYNRILKDLEEAAPLLPDKGSIKFRPSKAAAYGLLARVFLTMENYDRALYYAERALDIHSELVDYNGLALSAPFPFQENFGESNPEVIFFLSTPTVSLFHHSRMDVDSALLRLYDPDDLRLGVYYEDRVNGNRYFKGSYYGFSVPFNGIATSELLLIRAECLVRAGRIDEGIKDLDNLRIKRYKEGTFQPYRLTDGDDALDIVLDERRRELAFRGLRWEDLRRLNRDVRYAMTVRRVIDDRVYLLEPNSSRFVFPIPPNIIELADLEQNDR